MTPLTAQAVLDAALDWYESEDRWCKNDYAETAKGECAQNIWEADRLCLLGALAKGARVNPVVFSLPIEEWPNALAVATRRLAHEIEPGNRFDCPHSIVLCFNDREDTSFEDARLVLKRAAEQGSK